MESKTVAKPLFEQQHKMSSGQVMEPASQQPSAISKPEPGMPSGLPKSTQGYAPIDANIVGIEGHNEGHTDPYLLDSIPTNISEVPVSSDLDASSSDMKQLDGKGKPIELLQGNETACSERNKDVAKENIEQDTVKDISVSAKVSDGTSSLRKTSAGTKVSDRIESGKSSMCRASTSSDASDESTCSSTSSNINKPHKANDSRWEAIQTIRARDGILGLNHFRLLKRLGCGDIGTVYLSELSGTKSCFAMKVMDKVSLASRKKLLRAQTEREILQCLDHPFLPTLYTHFETEKFSCLVMEYCPGGDLHTLRQRQPGKYFSEQAVK